VCHLALLRRLAMGQIFSVEFGCGARNSDLGDPVLLNDQATLKTCPNTTKGVDPKDFADQENECDPYRLHDTALSMESVMDDLQCQLLSKMMCLKAENLTLGKCRDDKDPLGDPAHKPGIQPDISGSSMPIVVEALRKLMDLRDELTRLDIHGDSVQGVVEALLKQQDLRDGLVRLRAGDGESHVKSERSRIDSGCEEWSKFDVLIEHYREVDQHRRACRLSSLSSGSTASSAQDGDSSAGSDLASEDVFDPWLNPKEVTVGSSSNVATAIIAPQSKVPCLFFEMTPRTSPLEVLDCIISPRYSSSLEVLDYQVTPRCNGSLEMVD